MKKEKYELMLQEFLGTKKYKELKQYTIKRIKRDFEKQTGFEDFLDVYSEYINIISEEIRRRRENASNGRNNNEINS